MEKFVVVSAKKLNGTRVMCVAQSHEECEATKKSLEASTQPWLQGIGPYTILSQADAESQKLYGRS